MKVALAQINTAVGDISGNGVRILQAYRKGVDAGAEIVVFPELSITGYPPRDLLLKRNFVDANIEALKRLAEATGKAAMLLGFVNWNPHQPGRELMNCAALLQEGAITATRGKTLLPSYDVFDEDRYFEPARLNAPVEFNDRLIGITICEDVWNDEDFWRERRYPADPAVHLAEQGAQIIFNLSASPWQVGKHSARVKLLSNLARKVKVPVVYVNSVGGNDELVFDGGSMVFNSRADLVGCGKFFLEEVCVVETEQSEGIPFPSIPDEEKVYRALGLGLRDYLFKCGFHGVVLGLSGGIDSAVTGAIAADALGPENVLGVSLPSKYSSQGSLDDARRLADKLRIRYEVIPIQPVFEVMKKQMAPLFAGRPEDATEENMQARIRGMILMSISNKFGSLLLTTGNKSELAVGYCTLYGEMCGGLAVISDVPKTMVYRLARWINRKGEIIPTASIQKAPSAELRPNQKDQDSLPPYEVLDDIIEAYVVEGKLVSEIVERGHELGMVRQIIAKIDRSEYKRRQAAPGIKVTSKAFGMGRRIPIAHQFQDT